MYGIGDTIPKTNVKKTKLDETWCESEKQQKGSTTGAAGGRGVSISSSLSRVEVCISRGRVL